MQFEYFSKCKSVECEHSRELSFEHFVPPLAQINMMTLEAIKRKVFFANHP